MADDTVLLRIRGGGSTGYFSMNASWPFAILSVFNDSITFEMLFVKYSVPFSEITSIKLVTNNKLIISYRSNSKYIYFGSIGSLQNVADLLEQKGVKRLPGGQIMANKVFKTFTIIMLGVVLAMVLFFIINFSKWG